MRIAHFKGFAYTMSYDIFCFLSLDLFAESTCQRGCRVQTDQMGPRDRRSPPMYVRVYVNVRTNTHW